MNTDKHRLNSATAFDAKTDFQRRSFGRFSISPSKQARASCSRNASPYSQQGVGIVFMFYLRSSAFICGCTSVVAFRRCGGRPAAKVAGLGR
jgi:hypothetical protein